MEWIQKIIKLLNENNSLNLISFLDKYNSFSNDELKEFILKKDKNHTITDYDIDSFINYFRDTYYLIEASISMREFNLAIDNDFTHFEEMIEKKELNFQTINFLMSISEKILNYDISFFEHILFFKCEPNTPLLPFSLYGEINDSYDNFCNKRRQANYIRLLFECYQCKDEIKFSSLIIDIIDTLFNKIDENAFHNKYILFSSTNSSSNLNDDLIDNCQTLIDYKYLEENEIEVTEDVECFVEMCNRLNSVLNFYYPYLNNITEKDCFNISIEDLNVLLEEPNINDDEREYYLAIKGYILLSSQLEFYFLIYSIKNYMPDKFYLLYKKFEDLLENVVYLLNKNRNVLKHFNNSLCQKIHYFKSKEENYKIIIYITSIMKNIIDLNITELLKLKKDIQLLLLGINGEHDYIDIWIDKICNEIQTKIQNEFNLETNKSKIIEELNHPELKGNDYKVFLNILSTAETLYEKHVTDNSSSKNYDYSFVSIMYYKSLECILNTLLYTPYCEQVLTKKGYKYINTNCNDYLSVDNSKIFMFYSSRDKQFLNTIELGKINTLLSKINNVPKYKEFLIKEYNLDDNKINKLISLQERKLKKCVDNRNNAAHSTENIDFETTKHDKIFVYDNFSSNLKGLIKNLLDLLINQ